MRTGIQYSVLVLSLLAASHSDAAVFGTVGGLVQDPQQQAMAHVLITIRSPSSGWQQTAETDVHGRFVFQAVPTGDYVLPAAMPGFRTIEKIDPGATRNGHGHRLCDAAGHGCRNGERREQRRDRQHEVRDDREPREPWRNRTHAGRAPHEQPGTRHAVRARLVHDSRPTAHPRRSPGVLARRRRAGAQHEHREQCRAAVRSERHRDDRHPAGRLLGGLRRARLRRFQRPARSGFERNREAEAIGSYGNLHETNDQFSVGDHSERVAYYVSGNVNASDAGLEPPTPATLHDRTVGAGAFGALIIQPTPVDQIRLVSSVRGDRYEVPNTPDDQAAGIDDIERERDAFINLSWMHTVGSKAFVTVSPFYHYTRAAFDAARAIQSSRRLTARPITSADRLYWPLRASPITFAPVATDSFSTIRSCSGCSRPRTASD
jgi:hypothetical protein